MRRVCIFKLSGTGPLLRSVRPTMRSASSIQKRALVFIRILASVAVIYFVARLLTAGGFHPALVILLSYPAVVALLSGILCKRGSPRYKAALLPNAPMAVLMVAGMIFGDTDRAIERQVLPAWVVAAIFLAIGLVVSAVMVCRASKRNEDSA